MVLFGHLSAATDDLTFMTGIMVLPQRETPLVAKQTAEVDVLSRGRMRLGVGVGWNEREYGSLGKEFRTRGKRIEEQIDVLRSLWGNDLVNYDGRWHEIESAGINPRPVQQPIPVWMGGGADIVLQRIARIADGWIAPRYTLEEYEEQIDRLREYLSDHDRDPDSFPIHVRVNTGSYDHEELIDRIHALHDLGATHVAFGTHGNDLPSPEAHIENIRAARKAVEAADL
jgi:probable F420-dependent oxidoreductase